MSDRDFWTMLGYMADDYSVKSRHVGQVVGLPDVSGVLKPWYQKGRDLLQILIPQIEDNELRGLFNTFDLQTQKIEEDLDNQFIELIAKFFGLPAPQNERDRRKLTRRVNKNISLEGPVWAAQPEYQQLAEQSKQAFAAVEETKRRIDERLAHLLAMTPDDVEVPVAPAPITVPNKRLLRPHNWDPTGGQPRRTVETVEHVEISKEEFGDPRAKDLIDEADGGLDSKRAIHLLHRALRYGRTGIQACKAYQGLGMIYDERGDTARAIKYYTQAMEAWRPQALLLFWRGELYYRRGQWAEARDDLERALAFPPGDGLVSPDRELAEEYLAEIRSNKS
jgi:tetratricopeptide (TPR) repeat protein